MDKSSRYIKNTRINDNSYSTYIKLYKSGELKKIGEELWENMKSCTLCPRDCKVNRLSGERGVCGADSSLEVAAFHPHFGEEKPLVGTRGSGTIFFTHCGLRCVFCINCEISQEGVGSLVSIEELAEMMLRLQKKGCHNINLVTPTHYSPHIVLAINIAAERGLRLPIAYNTCGWEHVNIIEKLEGVVDIYLADFKYFEGKMSSKYSMGASSYPELTKKAILEMQRQVGTAKPGFDGLITKGLMMRHLVMPGGVSGSKKVVEWIAKNLPKDTYLNIMSQYRPVCRANRYSEISRPITRKEYVEVVEYAVELGLTNLDIQGY